LKEEGRCKEKETGLRESQRDTGKNAKIIIEENKKKEIQREDRVGRVT
jgi:hypothetical protein